MGNIRGINIKNRTYYFFDDMINIKEFDSNLHKIARKSYKHNIYYIEYVTKKDSKYVNIHNVNPLYFIVNKVDGFTEENERNT